MGELLSKSISALGKSRGMDGRGGEKVEGWMVGRGKSEGVMPRASLEKLR